MKKTTWIRLALMIASLSCGVSYFIYWFTNPELTTMQVFLDMWRPILIMVLCFALSEVIKRK